MVVRRNKASTPDQSRMELKRGEEEIRASPGCHCQTILWLDSLCVALRYVLGKNPIISLRSFLTFITQHATVHVVSQLIKEPRYISENTASTCFYSQLTVMSGNITNSSKDWVIIWTLMVRIFFFKRFLFTSNFTVQEWYIFKILTVT